MVGSAYISSKKTPECVESFVKAIERAVPKNEKKKKKFIKRIFISVSLFLPTHILRTIGPFIQTLGPDDSKCSNALLSFSIQ